MTNNLVPLIRKAQAGDKNAMSILFESFRPLILKNSIGTSKRINYDCYQDLSLQFILAVNAFDLEKYLDK